VRIHWLPHGDRSEKSVAIDTTADLLPVIKSE